MHYTETWCVVKEPLALRFTQIMSGTPCARAHVSTSLSRFPGTAGLIVLKFGRAV